MIFSAEHRGLCRGMAQQFDATDLGNGTCTASRMLPPTHGYLENTVPSMQASFEAGADIVEVDVHPTTDGRFAVFHDWTLDCRTNGHGVTREHSMAELKKLDVGYGYTADGGITFPYGGGEFSTGIDTPEDLACLPADYSGGVWTNEVELLAGILKQRGH